MIVQINGDPPRNFGSKELWIPMNPRGKASKTVSLINQYHPTTKHRSGFSSCIRCSECLRLLATCNSTLWSSEKVLKSKFDDITNAILESTEETKHHEKKQEEIYKKPISEEKPKPKPKPEPEAEPIKEEPKETSETQTGKKEEHHVNDTNEYRPRLSTNCDDDSSSNDKTDVHSAR